MSIAGIWDLEIVTPIGRLAVVLDLSETASALAGTARGADETVPLIEPTLTGNRLTWKQSIRKPVRLNLNFDVTVDGDKLAGTSRAGKLPPSRVLGTRRAGLEI